MAGKRVEMGITVKTRFPREEMLPVANDRGNNADDPNKRPPLDFVLWQAGHP